MATLRPLPSHITALIRQLCPLGPYHRALTTSSSSSAATSTTSQTPTDFLFPTTPTCPPSTCACAAMPTGLDIDHERSMVGTMPPYAQHVVIRTGRCDWSSKIEDDVATSGAEVGLSNLAKSLKQLLGRGGQYHDPARPTLITNCSLPPVPRNPFKPERQQNNRKTYFHSVHVFPQNIRIPKLRDTPEAHESFVRQFLLPPNRLAWEILMPRKNKRLGGDREAVEKTRFPLNQSVELKRMQYQIVSSPTILICGHDSRDTRCGVLGPLLQEEFDNCIKEGLSKVFNRGLKLTMNPMDRKENSQHPLRKIKVALTSHVGGHAFAGNVIIYIPNGFRLENREVSPLAGKGIWYGRVEPRHVQGILKETVIDGRLIEELLRGVHSRSKDG